MKKILFVASVTIHITTFHIPYLKMFKEAGYEVHVACNGEKEIPYCDKLYNLNFSRSPFAKSNISVYKELKKIIEDEKYDIIECNTPTASVLTRLASRKINNEKLRVIYIAHGFHFFKGAPFINWAIYYPIEKFLSKYTDDLITINEEDYNFAREKLNAKNTYRIHGIGVNQKKYNEIFTQQDRIDIRKSLSLDNEDFAILFVGELNKNKNQIMIIDAVKELIKENKKIKLFFAGEGELREFYEKKIKEYGLEENIVLLGYRNDIPKLLKSIDLYVSASQREGLGLNLIEAKMANIPVIATNNRGHREIVKDNEDGFLVEIGDIKNLKNKINILYSDKELRNKFIENSKKNVQKFYLSNVEKELKNIYFK